MKTPRWFSIAVILLCLGLPTFADVGKSDSELKEALVGKWFVQTEGSRTELINNKDGTFSSVTTVDGKQAWTTSGEWTVKKGKLEGIYRKASIPDIKLGEVNSSELLEVTRDYYVIKNRNGVKRKYERMK